MGKHKPYVVVVGCGRLGSLVAGRLSEAGISVVVVDANPDAFGALAPTFSGFTITGDAAELAVLEQAEVGRADLLLAATSLDTVNLMVTQAATKVLGCRAAIARVFDPRRGATYRQLGVETICPTTLAASELYERVTAAFGHEKGGE
jgi:trk system potassium uptake protein TrkA